MPSPFLCLACLLLTRTFFSESCHPARSPMKDNTQFPRPFCASTTPPERSCSDRSLTLALLPQCPLSRFLAPALQRVSYFWSPPPVGDVLLCSTDCSLVRILSVCVFYFFFRRLAPPLIDPFPFAERIYSVLQVDCQPFFGRARFSYPFFDSPFLIYLIIIPPLLDAVTPLLYGQLLVLSRRPMQIYFCRPLSAIVYSIPA